MDNVTHALAGLLLAEGAVALAERRTGRPAPPGLRRAAAIVGVVTAELPDIDIAYAGPALGMGPLGYLLHHRGHTHTVVFAVLAALLVWGITLALRRAARAPDDAPFERALLPLALAGTLSHIALDYTNNYGVHPFWPLSNAWHYGDAVFIVEPWLWIAALAPLILVARRTAARVLLGIALVGIVAAAWTTGQVGRGATIVVTVGALAWLAVVAVAPPSRRVALGVAAWLGFEALSFAASRAAGARLAEAVGGAGPVDAVLTPAIANPLCFRALVVELDGETYRASTATVAPFPGLRGVGGCALAPMSLDMAPSARPATPAVRWGAEWTAPRAELAAIAAANCDVAAALRFIRVPVWRRSPDGAVTLGDLRYGGTGGGFATIVAPARPATCPAHVPPWIPPRQELLGAR